MMKTDTGGLNEKQRERMEIKRIKKREILYLTRTGPYGPENQQLMEKFKAGLRERQLLKDDSEILALVHDDPQVTLPEMCRYDVGLLVSSFEENQWQELKPMVVPESDFAVFRISHTASAIIEVMQTMAERIALQGFRINSQMPIVECYRQSDVQNGYCEIQVPIRFGSK